MKLVASRGYLKDKKLSASQLNVWIERPKDYIKKYYIGITSPDTIYTLFGKLIHKAIENGYSDNPVLDMLIAVIPRLDVPEKEIVIPTMIGDDEVILNGFLDSYDETEDEIIDYKTGKEGNWSDEIVASDNQFKFYTLLHKLNTGRMLKKITIVHLHTTLDANGEVILTGKYDVYCYIPSQKDIDFIVEKIKEFIVWAKSLTEEDIFNS